jgi:tetratricopeptide (TPR) repeat protein
LQAQKQLYGDGDERIARSLIILGSMYLALHKFAESEELLTRAVELRRKLYGEDHASYASALFTLSDVTSSIHGPEVAVPMYRQVLDIQQRRLVPGHYYIARTRHRLGQCLVRLKQWDEAEQLLRQAITEFNDKPKSLAVRGLFARRTLADCLIRQEKFEQAEIEVLDALQIAQAEFADVGEPAKVATSLARLYQSWGKADLAAEWKARTANPATAPAQEPAVPAMVSDES